MLSDFLRYKFQNFKFVSNIAALICTQDNIRKAWVCLRHGGVRSLVSRIVWKLQGQSIRPLFTDIVYANDWLRRVNLPQDTNVVVDIIVPVYNAFEYTKTCLESVIANTDIDYRLFVINDCSEDKNINVYLSNLSDKKILKNRCIEYRFLKNKENMGFIATVNRGMALSKNHVVLLNTDTEVPPNWLSRLIGPILADERIATVTPYSNSAEMCSFPELFKNNELPFNMTVSQVDDFFQLYGGRKVIDIPTGVGFCMAINRRVIEQVGVFDTIYGKGYGEENDWCRRAASKGYRNVHVTNLFVYHKHGASFSIRQDKSKEDRVTENLNKLLKRYPDYMKLIHAYIAKDPCKWQRIFIQAAISARQSGKKIGTMFISHSLGGGTAAYQNEQISRYLTRGRVYSLECLADGKTAVLKEYTPDGRTIAYLDLEDMTSADFRSLSYALNLTELYINHTLGFKLPDLLNWIMDSGIPYIVVLHDFYMICPSYNLLNYKTQYCQAETDLAVCRSCLEKIGEKSDIEAWRLRFGNFLQNASSVIAPSQNTANIYLKYYPSVSIIVHEHNISPYIYKTYSAKFLDEPIKTIAVIGAIGVSKGSDIVYALADKIERANLPLRLVVIGFTDRQNDPWTSPSGKFEITGAYDAKDISDLLMKYKVTMVLIPSIWPETYSYTTSEAIYSGYKTISFNLGAQADRIKETKMGYLVNEISAEALLETILAVMEERQCS